MLGQVAVLGELRATVGVTADVGELIGVDSDMIEEIVPFPKNLVASLMCAVLEPDSLATFTLFQGFKDDEFFGSWHMLLNANFC